MTELSSSEAASRSLSDVPARTAQTLHMEPWPAERRGRALGFPAATSLPDFAEI